MRRGEHCFFIKNEVLTMYALQCRNKHMLVKSTTTTLKQLPSTSILGSCPNHP